MNIFVSSPSTPNRFIHSNYTLFSRVTEYKEEIEYEVNDGRVSFSFSLYTSLYTRKRDLDDIIIFRDLHNKFHMT